MGNLPPRALAVAVCVCLTAATSAQTFPLTVRDTVDPTHPLIDMCRQWHAPEPVRRGVQPELPDGVSGPAVTYRVVVGGKPLMMVVAGSRRAKLLVDTDADGSVADEEPRDAAKADGDEMDFGIVSAPGPKGDAVVRLQVGLTDLGGGLRYLRVGPGGMFEGTAELEGQPYTMAVLDGDMDGRHDRRYALGARQPDWLMIDLNGNGEFDGPVYESPEIVPLPRMVAVAGTYYSVEVEAAGSAVTLVPAQPALGTLALAAPGMRMTLLSDCGLHVVDGTRGEWSLPAGRYAAMRVTLGATDDEGRKWLLTGDSPGGKLGRLEIKEGETLSIEAGPPVTVKAAADRNGRDLSVGLTLIGRAGESYGTRATRDGRDVPVPRLRILDETGNVLTSGAFRYG